MREILRGALVAGLVLSAVTAPVLASPVSVEFETGESDEAYRFTDAEKRRITEIAERTFQELRELLPSLGPELRLQVGSGARVIEATGELGAAVAPGVISWTVDPSRPEGVPAIAEKRLRSTLFHEAHHQARGWVMQGGKRPTRFMEAVIAEGLATAFERDAAGSEPPWGDYPEDVDRWVEELNALSLAEGFGSYAQWMFRHPDGRLWIGYRAGTYLADRAMAKSGKSAAELVQTPTDEVLKLAGVE